MHCNINIVMLLLHSLVYNPPPGAALYLTNLHILCVSVLCVPFSSNVFESFDYLHRRERKKKEEKEEDNFRLAFFLERLFGWLTGDNVQRWRRKNEWMNDDDEDDDLGGEGRNSNIKYLWNDHTSLCLVLVGCLFVCVNGLIIIIWLSGINWLVEYWWWWCVVSW